MIDEDKHTTIFVGVLSAVSGEQSFAGRLSGERNSPT
jgi:hypothetical protein